MPKRFENETFRNSAPSWANACVGNNGSPGIVDYAEGFANAANVLLEQVLEHRGLKHSTDTFVYPICFNMRHAIELYLKAAIGLMPALLHHDIRLTDVDVDTSHNIGRLWDYIKEHATNIDRRYWDLITQLDRGIADFAEVDATGQVFRYPFDRDNQKHLTQLAIINLGVLWTNFKVLIERLKSLSRLGEQLVEEYRYKTYTSHLSRFDLICVAYRLPPRGDWPTAAFADAKDDIRARFKLSGKEFSKAVEIIEGNLEMAALIDKPQPFRHLTETQLQMFFDSWRDYHDLDKMRRRFNGIPNDVDAAIKEAETFEAFDLRDILDDKRDVRMTAWPHLSKEVTPEAFGELSAMFYFARDRLRYSEAFERQREFSIRDFVAKRAAGEDEFRHSVFHLLEKTSALEHVSNTLRFFGRLDIAASLLKRCELAEYSEQILEESSIRMRARHEEASASMGVAVRHPSCERL
ncbi:hypothetical protein B0G74_3686 [Paraburkholderia sp. BL9I2N2]|nr:hypothetical protein B0G74_3686 [Paraburkholderia sp. BL9I2N2]